MRTVSDPQEWTQLTGQPAQSPAFYVQGQGRIQQIGTYIDAPGLIQSVLKIVVKLGTLIYNKRHHDPEIGSIVESLPPPKEEAPQPFKRSEPIETVTEPEVDWSHGRAVLISKAFLKGRAGFLVGLSSGMGSKAIRRAVLDGTDGKIDFETVLERTKPARFEAVVKASGFEPDPVGFILLWKRQDLGLKGLIVRKFEQTLPEKIRGKLPVEIIFERAHPEDFELVETALRVAEPELEPSKQRHEPKAGFSIVSLLKDPKSYTLTILGALAADRGQARLSQLTAWWRRRKQKDVTA